MTVLVFDIETIPDVDSGRRLFGLEGLSDRETAEVMFTRQRQDSGDASDFLRLHLHRVVAVSVALAAPDRLAVWSLGDADADEKEIVRRFFEGVEKYTPTLVSWNGRGFDLPVLHYRSLLHGVTARRYWETGDSEQSFRWNNYLNRFHHRHTDLMDVLAGYEFRANAPLSDIAVMLGFPGKLGMSGGKVWERFLAGDVEGIRAYCETDVVNTYLVYLRFELARGNLDEAGYERERERVREMLRGDERRHFGEFLEAWEG